MSKKLEPRAVPAVSDDSDFCKEVLLSCFYHQHMLCPCFVRSAVHRKNRRLDWGTSDLKS